MANYVEGDLVDVSNYQLDGLDEGVIFTANGYIFKVDRIGITKTTLRVIGEIPPQL